MTTRTSLDPKVKEQMDKLIAKPDEIRYGNWLLIGGRNQYENEYLQDPAQHKAAKELKDYLSKLPTEQRKLAADYGMTRAAETKEEGKKSYSAARLPGGYGRVESGIELRDIPTKLKILAEAGGDPNLAITTLINNGRASEPNNFTVEEQVHQDKVGNETLLGRNLKALQDKLTSTLKPDVAQKALDALMNSKSGIKTPVAPLIAAGATPRVPRQSDTQFHKAGTIPTSYELLKQTEHLNPPSMEALADSLAKKHGKEVTDTLYVLLDQHGVASIKEDGIDIQRREANGQDYLFHVAQSRTLMLGEQKKLFEKLVKDHGFDPNRKDKSGKTAQEYFQQNPSRLDQLSYQREITLDSAAKSCRSRLEYSANPDEIDRACTIPQSKPLASRTR